MVFFAIALVVIVTILVTVTLFRKEESCTLPKVGLMSVWRSRFHSSRAKSEKQTLLVYRFCSLLNKHLATSLRLGFIRLKLPIYV